MKLEYIWVEENANIKYIVNEEMKIVVKWSKKPSEDYAILSRQYMDAGYIILKEIIEEPHNDNIRYNTWFFPGVYMVRQAIELLIKAGIAVNGATKSELQEIFIASKHNVIELYRFYKDRYGVEKINQAEQKWLEQYLKSIELVDSSSDLFRYPFRDDFMQQYGDKALDVYHMGIRLIYCYSTMNKMIYGEWFKGSILKPVEDPQFLQITSTTQNNCYLWDSPWSDGFYKQVTGYSEVATFLFERFKKTKDEALLYPIVFLMRNAIELGLKRLLHMQMEHRGIDERIIRNKKNSHLLYKDLWRSIKSMLVHYAEMDNQDMKTLELAESYIIALNKLDKNGDMFRYPCSYSNEYKFNDENVDVANYYNYLLGIFHFIEGCDAWLGNIRDYEMEMKAEYEDEMRRDIDWW